MEYMLAITAASMNRHNDPMTWLWMGIFAWAAVVGIIKGMDTWK